MHVIISTSGLPPAKIYDLTDEEDEGAAALSKAIYSVVDLDLVRDDEVRNRLTYDTPWRHDTIAPPATANNTAPVTTRPVTDVCRDASGPRHDAG